ncbi:MAG: DUF1508 domain-containing protein [Halobacteriota archaeon]
MSVRNPHRRLFELYDKYVGEAENRREVYGYWLFILGYVVGIAGVIVYIATPPTGEMPFFFEIREIAIVLAAFGLMVGILGIVLQMPLSQLGVYAAVCGGVIALFSIGYFTTIYPQDWLRTGAAGSNRTVIVLYLVGVGLVAGVAALVPVLTGERSFLLERGFEPDERFLIGDERRGGLFAVYRRNPAEWTWRLVEQEAVADGVRDFASRPDVESSIQAIKENVLEAGLMEIKHAAFRLYRDGDAWRWLLMEADGSVAANSPSAFSDRYEAEESVSVMKEFGPDAELIDIEGAAFDLRLDGPSWRWHLLDEDRDVLAEAPNSYRDRERALESMDAFKQGAKSTDLLSIDRLGVEVRHDEDDWSWRIVNNADEPLATSAAAFDSGTAVRAAVDDVQRHAFDAPVLDGSTPGFEVVAADEEGLQWRLIADDERIAQAHAPVGEVDTAEGDVRHLQTVAPEAALVEREELAFELFSEDGDEWRWRLVDADREVFAESAATYPSEEAGETAITHAVEQTGVAELIEFEKAAFQLYEADVGGWRWRLIDEGGSVMADSGEDYESRDDAASSMTVLKENAPDANLLEIESAAFELFTDDAGEWAWRLVDEQGNTIARGARTHGAKAGAKEATEAMREAVDEAAMQVVDRGVFQRYELPGGDGRGWHWQYLHADGRILADGVTAHTTQDNVNRAIESVKQAAPDAAIHHVDALAFELRSDEGAWSWRLLDDDRATVAESTTAYQTRTEARAIVESVRDTLADAGVFELSETAYRVRETDGGSWCWELVDGDRTALTRSPREYDSREATESAVATVQHLAPDAGVLEYENAAFECVEVGDGWRWRLVDEEGTTLAESAAVFETRADATEAQAAIREDVTKASLLEIETAAFELHEGEEGWRWRLVDDSGTTVAESTTAYPTRTEARAGMQALKNYGPEAAVVVAG